ncbi:MAG: uroporphyrinogen-III C-methyltransferase [Rhizobiales bacterium]|nr:uroporphyrinogen-III C-methyltransferase [Hyphomicrobiales bacterium]
MNGSRMPCETGKPSIKPLSRLPVFFTLAGRRAIVAGDSPAIVWKVELLSAAGAQVDVFVPHPSEELLALTADAPRGDIRILARAWKAGDFKGAAIAVGACESNSEAERFAVAARTSGVPVNVVDNPAYCDFTFGSVVNRSPLVIGISTDGAAPIFAQSIRAKLEGLIPQGFACWAQAAKNWRTAVQTSGLSFTGRRSFWLLFTRRAIISPDHAPSGADFADILAATRTEGSTVEKGSVTFVYVSQRDPELLTLRAMRALQSADVILFDHLVSREVLDYVRREARKIPVEKTSDGRSGVDQFNAPMLALAKCGKRLVRLFGGNPMICRQANEEIAACRAAGIAVEMVPGIITTPAETPRASGCYSDRRERAPADASA